jgi:HEPN domain-containing protein
MRSTESGFNELVYLAAAQERMTTVNLLLGVAAPHHVEVCYLAGVAVECLLLAYLHRNGGELDAGHNLGLLAIRSGFYEGMKPEQRQATAALIGEFVTRWQNNHRYRSEAALRRYFNEKKLYYVSGKQTTREDVLEFNARILVNAATEIVTLGVRRWPPS